MTENHLQGIAVGLNQAVVESIRAGEPTDLDKVAVEETLKEVEKGWLRPCSIVDLRNHHIAKRFPIQQKEKVRLIDDFSVCGVNGTVGLPERLRVESIEDLTAALLVGMDMKGSNLCDTDLCGRTYDLKSAYKQFGVSQECADRMKVALKHPTSGIAYFDVLALPFGATASVSAFLRLSASIAFIGVVALKICWTVFFDDYSVVCPRKQAKEVGFFIESLFKLLGVQYAADGDKATPFDAVFKTLGLQLDVSGWQEGFFKIGHTESRRAELLADLEKLTAQSTVVTKELERLHGRLVWMRAFVFGRRLHAAVNTVSKFARCRARSFFMNGELQYALGTLLKRLAIAEPLRVVKPSLHVMHVYTDGAYEPDTSTPGSIGAVLVDSDGDPLEFFGGVVPKSLLDELLESSKHPIYELEILPVVLALGLWAPRLLNQHIVFHLDNEAARSAFIRATGATKCAEVMIDRFVDMEHKLNIWPWFSRVPSASNPSDAASGLDFSVSWLRKAKHVTLVIPAHFSQWGSNGCAANMR